MNLPRSLKLVIVAGARPNFMKVAPLIRAIQAGPGGAPGELGVAFSYVLVHTGQHYDEKMSDVFFRELGIPQPDVNLGVGSGSHAEQTAQTMLKFEPVCLEHRPDWVVVVGDVNSTVACTLVAAKLGIRVAHVEAGLRSFDRTMPEEINRLVTDSIADLLLTPSDDGNRNLEREGVDASRIRLVGNIMIDALVANLPQARGSLVLERAGVEAGKFVYVTLHRPSNVDDPGSLRAIMQELGALSSRLPVVFPIHPRTRRRLEDLTIPLPPNGAIRFLEPVGYHDSLKLAESARFVLTDSGGLQEETTYLGTPCLTLRPNTERPITVTLGTNRLTSVTRLAGDISEAEAGTRPRSVPPFWDGRTAERVLAELARFET